MRKGVQCRGLLLQTEEKCVCGNMCTPSSSSPPPPSSCSTLSVNDDATAAITPTNGMRWCSGERLHSSNCNDSNAKVRNLAGGATWAQKLILRTDFPDFWCLCLKTVAREGLFSCGEAFPPCSYLENVAPVWQAKQWMQMANKLQLQLSDWQTTS